MGGGVAVALGGAAPPGCGARGGTKTIFGPRVRITFRFGPWYINLGTKIYWNVIQTRGTKIDNVA